MTLPDPSNLLKTGFDGLSPLFERTSQVVASQYERQKGADASQYERQKRAEESLCLTQASCHEQQNFAEMHKMQLQAELEMHQHCYHTRSKSELWTPTELYVWATEKRGHKGQVLDSMLGAGCDGKFKVSKYERALKGKGWIPFQCSCFDRRNEKHVNKRKTALVCLAPTPRDGCYAVLMDVNNSYSLMHHNGVPLLPKGLVYQHK